MLNLDKYKVERGIKIKTSQLSPNDYNPNKTTERIDEAIRKSLQHYGQVLEILVRPDPDNKGKFIIIDGEHRFNHADKEVYVNVVHGLNENDAKKLTVILNETRGKADLIELSELLSQLNDELDTEELKTGLPFTEEELSNLLEIAKDTHNEQSEDDETDLENNEATDKIPSSQVKMIQLFFDTFTIQDFNKYTKFLTEQYESNNLTQCVLQALENEYENNNGN